MLAPKKQGLVKLMVLLFFLLLPGKIVPQTIRGESSLPNFNVKNLADVEVPSSRLAARSKWMLVYLEPNCGSCFGLLETLKQPETIPDLERKVVVIVAGATADEAQKIAEKNPWIPPQAWYADRNKEAMSALKLKGLPITIGFRKEHEEWRLAGFPKDGNAAQSILSSWCKE